MAQCPFHQDKSPSLLIRNDGTRLKCFSAKCVAHAGSFDWIDFAEKFNFTDGLLNSDANDPNDLFNAGLQGLRGELDRVYGEAERVAFSLDSGVVWPLPRSVPWEHGEWRGLSEEFLQGRGALHVLDSGELKSASGGRSYVKVPRLVLPIYHEADRSDLYAWVAEAVSPEHRSGPKAVSPKCRDMPSTLRRSWADSALFGLDTALAKSRDVLVLVEGPYDQMRLDDLGFPAAAILGTGKWRQTPRGKLNGKASLVVEKGFSRVVVFTDGDEPGDECARMIRSQLEGLVNVTRFRPPNGKDPGNCPESTLMELNKIVWP